MWNCHHPENARAKAELPGEGDEDRVTWLGGFDILETSQTRGMALSAPREEKAKVVVTMDNSV